MEVQKNKTYLGWLSLISAFIFVPYGAFVGIALAIVAFSRKDHDNTSAIAGFALSLAIILFLIWGLFF